MLFNRNSNLFGKKYFIYNSEFRENGSNLLLVSTLNPNFKPFVGESYSKSAWDLISLADITHGLKHDEVYGYLLDHLKKGNTIFGCEDSNLMLRRDEFIKFQSPDTVNLLESRSVRVSNSRHVGQSVRHNRVSYGIGSSISVSESFDEVKTVDVGQITITNKRFIFSGHKKSVDVDVKKIISITPYFDGIKLQRKGKQKVEYFTNVDDYIFNRKYANDVYHFAMDGNMIKALIESSLDDLMHISDLQLFEAKSIPKVESDNLDNSFRYDDFSLKYSNSWEKISNEANDIFTIGQKFDDYNCRINVSKDKLFENEMIFKDTFLNLLERQNLTTWGFKDIKINGIDMFTLSALAYNNDLLIESIFTYFNNSKNTFRVLLTHPFQSNAKLDYFNLINSIAIDSISPPKKEYEINFCMNCGTKVEKNSKFCINCGFKLS